MNETDTLERRFRRFTVTNLTLHLIAGQAVCFLFILSRPRFLEGMQLIPLKLSDGEIWRLVTFVFAPPQWNPVLVFFAWYLFYLMGSALERHWGALRYNLFLLVGYAATVAASFVAPALPASPAFLAGSVFLAFAYLYPEFEIYLFFVVPVKIKWLALITWVGYGTMFLTGAMGERLLILAAVANFLVFFWQSILLRISGGARSVEREARQIVEESKPLHRCAFCEITDRTHPDKTFRYCTICSPVQCYCEDHAITHKHILAESGEPVAETA